MLLIITNIADELSGVLTSMTLNELKPQIRDFNNFFAILSCYAYFKNKLSRNDRK